MKGGSGRDAGHGGESATFAVRVLPRAAKDGVAGLAGDAVRIRLTAPPVENRANEALVRFLADSLDVPKNRVKIVAGMAGRRKIVRVGGIVRSDLFRRLGLQEPPD